MYIYIYIYYIYIYIVYTCQHQHLWPCFHRAMPRIIKISNNIYQLIETNILQNRCPLLIILMLQNSYKSFSNH